MFVKSANLLGWRAKKHEEKVVVKIVKWILLGLFLIIFHIEVYAENRYINNMMVLNELEDSDVAEIEMRGNGESCRLSFGSDGVIYDTSCFAIVNSKGLKVYCTPNKKLCKTYAEIYAFIFNPRPQAVTIRGIVLVASLDSAIEFKDGSGSISFLTNSDTGNKIFFNCKSGDYCEVVGVVNDGFLVSVNNARKIQNKHINTSTDTQLQANANRTMAPKKNHSIQTEITWRSLGIGIHNPGEIKDWTYFGIKTAQEASKWIDALKPLGGISYAGAARIWKQNGFSATEVKDWVLIGAKTPERAQWWIKAGAKTPLEVQEWKNIGVDTTNNIYSWKSIEFNTPSKAKMWIDINIKESSEVKKWLNVGINIPKHVQAWKAVEVQNHNDVAAWKKNGLTTPEEVKKWKDSGITTAQQASHWIQADIASLSEIKKWQSIGINDGNTYKEWKKYVQNVDGAKEWMDASYTLSDVASQVSSGNLSPSDVKWSSIKNKFWILVLIIIGILVYRALQRKCPNCKSRDFTEIGRESEFIGYEKYSKNEDKYTKKAGIQKTRGSNVKVDEVYDVETTYKCNECGEIFTQDDRERKTNIRNR